jgi:uncharacterized protein (TIRG00374 family)
VTQPVQRALNSRYLRLILGILIAGVSLILAVRNVNVQEVAAVFSRADLSLVGWALASVAGTNLAKAARWKALMGPESQRLSLTRALMIILAGQALNTLYPARVGDLGRAWVAGETGEARAFALGTVVLEKLFDMLAYIFLFVILFLWIPLPDWVNQSVFSFSLVTLVGLGLVVLMAYRIETFTRWLDQISGRLPEQLRSRLQTWTRSAGSSLVVLRDRRSLLVIVGWSLIVWGSAVLTNHLTLKALKVQLPVTAPILILIILQIGMTLPSVPGRIGIFEYLCILSLAVFNVPQAQGLSYGILLHAVALVPQTVIGLVLAGVLGMGTQPGRVEGKISSPRIL